MLETAERNAPYPPKRRTHDSSMSNASIVASHKFDGCLWQNVGSIWFIQYGSITSIANVCFWSWVMCLLVWFGLVWFVCVWFVSLFVSLFVLRCNSMPTACHCALQCTDREPRHCTDRTLAQVRSRPTQGHWTEWRNWVTRLTRLQALSDWTHHSLLHIREATIAILQLFVRSFVRLFVCAFFRLLVWVGWRRLFGCECLFLSLFVRAFLCWSVYLRLVFTSDL